MSHGEKTSRLKYEELGQYLRLLTQGATQEQALEEVTPASQDRPLPAERPLDPVLDLDHPETLQRPLRARGRLSLDPLRVPDPLQPAMEAPRGERNPYVHEEYETPRPSGRPVAAMGAGSLYRSKHSSGPSAASVSPYEVKGTGKSPLQGITPPRPQDSFAAVARPRHMGAYTDAEPPAMDEATKALQTIAKTLTSKDEAVNHERGKVSSIGKLEERLVFLVRGCDALTVSVGVATVGKELYYALKSTATQGRPQLRAIQFPVNIGNRLAFGLASMSIGGRDIRTLPDYLLCGRLRLSFDD